MTLSVSDSHEAQRAEAESAHRAPPAIKERYRHEALIWHQIWHQFGTKSASFRSPGQPPSELLTTIDSDSLAAYRVEMRLKKLLAWHAWALSIDPRTVQAQINANEEERRARLAAGLAEMRAEQTRRALLEAQEKE
jgi:hypothetical protein